jgi:hypothetical protein
MQLCINLGFQRGLSENVLREYYKKYLDVVSLRMFYESMIKLNSLKAAQEAEQKAAEKAAAKV